MVKVPRRFKLFFQNNRNDIKYWKFFKINNKNTDGIAADIIRLTHSIEKGLTLENVKLGYGHQKQDRIISMVSKIEKIKSNYYKEVIKMAVNAINSYLIYHKIKNYRDDYFSKLEIFVNRHSEYLNENYGGSLFLNKADLRFKIKDIENFFNTRHSIRDFDSKSVDDDLIKKAIKLAQTAPSACNRQGYRCYVVDKSKANYLKKWLSGIGGFANKLDKIIIITGKTSSYRYYENNQYIVSASIYAAYLSLTLHLYGIGACLIQRPVIWTKEWDNIRKYYNISEDEQIIICLGIGMLKDKTIVPISHRLDVDEISSFIK